MTEAVKSFRLLPRRFATGQSLTDTTLHPKAVMFPTEDKLTNRARERPGRDGIFVNPTTGSASWH